MLSARLDALTHCSEQSGAMERKKPQGNDEFLKFGLRKLCKSQQNEADGGIMVPLCFHPEMHKSSEAYANLRKPAMSS